MNFRRNDSAYSVNRCQQFSTGLSGYTSHSTSTLFVCWFIGNPFCLTQKTVKIIYTLCAWARQLAQTDWRWVFEQSHCYASFIKMANRKSTVRTTKNRRWYEIGWMSGDPQLFQVKQSDVPIKFCIHFDWDGRQSVWTMTHRSDESQFDRISSVVLRAAMFQQTI